MSRGARASRSYLLALARALARISHKATVCRASIATIRSRIRHLPGTCVQAPKDRVFLWRAPGLRPLGLVRCCMGLQIAPRATRHAYGGEKSRLGQRPECPRASDDG